MNPLKLTPRQQDVLRVIERALAHTGAPPTRAEIATTLGFKSANAAEEHLRALARKGAIDLVGGTSRGIRLKGQQQAQHGQQLGLDIPGLAQLTLPLVGRVAAGQPILAEQHVEQQVSVAADLFLRQPDYLLRVKGSSMQGAGILDGDLLAVQRASEARNGQVVVARLGEEVTVKRFERRDGRVRLLPENPDFAPIEVGPEREDFVLEGLAVGLLRTSAW